MALDWLNESPGELIVRRRYARAIQALRAQFEGKSPDAKTRLQLADLLVLAGRQAEAIPILTGLADEFAADGFAAKAVAILKRIEKLEPGRPDVDERLSLLVNRNHKPPPPVRFSPPLRLEIGIEAEAEPPASETPPEAPQEPAVPPEVESVVEPEVPVVAETAAAPTAAAVEESPRPAVARRIRSILGRLLAARHDDTAAAPPEPSEVTATQEAVASSASEATAQAEPAASQETGSEAAPDVVEPEDDAVEEVEPQADVPEDVTAAPSVEPEVEPVAPEAAVEAVPEPEPKPEPAPEPEHEGVTHRIKGFLGRLWPGRHDEEHVPEVSAEEFDLSPQAQAPPPEAPPAAPEAPPEKPALEDPPMSEEVFHERLLDVIEDVLRDGVKRGPRPPAAIDGRKLAESPLLGELSEEERLRLVHGLRLLTYEPGDVILTEGEPGGTLFLLTTGTVKVFVRNPASRNIEVRALREGDFFGEVSILSGRPRTATITAASDCELLELNRPTLDALGHDHPGIVDTLEAHYIQRTQSPDNAAVRSAAVPDAETPHRAAEVLRAHFGDRTWDPKMRLKLADVLLKAGKQQEALPILVDLADAMARQGHPEKAIAILKKIERIERRHTEEINLSPLGRPAPAPPAAEEPPPPPRRSREKTTEFFEGWVDLVKDTVRRGLPSANRLSSSRPSSAGLLLSPLFEDFSDEEIQALIDGLRLLVFEPGDIILTEGEPGSSVLVVTTGAVKVSVRSPSGHNAEVGELGEGEFFGEMSTLSGRPRSATVTAAAHTEVLELDKATLDAICAAHPRVRDVLEEVYIQRAAHPYAAMIRGVAAP